MMLACPCRPRSNRPSKQAHALISHGVRLTPPPHLNAFHSGTDKARGKRQPGKPGETLSRLLASVRALPLVFVCFSLSIHAYSIDFHHQFRPGAQGIGRVLGAGDPLGSFMLADPGLTDTDTSTKESQTRFHTASKNKLFWGPWAILVSQDESLVSAAFSPSNQSTSQIASGRRRASHHHHHHHHHQLLTNVSRISAVRGLWCQD
jgi:hypothetical protein